MAIFQVCHKKAINQFVCYDKQIRVYGSRKFRHAFIAGAVKNMHGV
jgi:hypothetical protein